MLDMANMLKWIHIKKQVEQASASTNNISSTAATGHAEQSLTAGDNVWDFQINSPSSLLEITFCCGPGSLLGLSSCTFFPSRKKVSIVAKKTSYYY